MAANLPPGWEEFFDDDERRPYYYDQLNNVSQWERPTEPARTGPGRNPATQASEQGAVPTSHSHFDPPVGAGGQLYSGAGGQQAYGDNEGQQPASAHSATGGKQTLKDLVKQLSSAGRFNEAESLIKQVLSDVQAQVGVNAPATAEFLNMLVLLYHKSGKNQLAADCGERAWLILRAAYGEQDKRVATALNNYALALSPLGDFQKAEYLFKKALDVRVQIFGDGHPEVAQTLHNLALLYRSSKRWDLAARNFTTARSIWRGHGLQTLVALSYREEAQLRRQMGHMAEAYRLYNTELDILRKCCPPTHKAVLESERNVLSLQEHAYSDDSSRGPNQDTSPLQAHPQQAAPIVQQPQHQQQPPHQPHPHQQQHQQHQHQQQQQQQQQQGRAGPWQAWGTDGSIHV